jgi:CheY-like chemotaxis protein
MAQRSDRKVLIVEDEMLLRLIGSDTLAEAGFEVLEADNADAALLLLAQDRDVQLLFTDIRMPGSMDGLELARIVHERWPTIKILLTSGDTWPTRDAIPDDGRFIAKPYRLSNLQQEISALMAEKPS